MDAKLKENYVKYFWRSYKWDREFKKRGGIWMSFRTGQDFENVVVELIGYTLERTGFILSYEQLLKENSEFGNEWKNTLSCIDRLLDGGASSIVEAWKLWKRYANSDGRYDIEAALEEQRRLDQNDQSVSWTLKMVHIALGPVEKYVPGYEYGDRKKRTLVEMKMTDPVLSLVDFESSFLHTNPIQELRSMTGDDNCVEFVKVKTDRTVKTIWFLGQDWSDMMESLKKNELLTGSDIRMENGEVIEIRVAYVLDRKWSTNQVGDALKDLKELTGIKLMTVDVISRLDAQKILSQMQPGEDKERLTSFFRDILHIPGIEEILESWSWGQKLLDETRKRVGETSTLSQKIEMLLAHV